MTSKWLELDSIEYVLASAYSDGKGYLFEAFFGWRQTRQFGQKVCARFVLPNKGWEEIDILKRLYEKHLTKQSN